MPFLIGTDEAGYGPNLGPLTVTGSLWRVPSLNIDLYQALDPAILQTACRRGEDDSRLHVADSKAVYSGSKSIASLERSVLTLLRSVRGSTPNNERELLTALFSKCVEDRLALFAGEHAMWSGSEPLPLPVECDPQAIESAAKTFAKATRKADVELSEVLCRPLFPAAFNRLVNQLGNKANVLSAQTMRIVADLLDNTAGHDVLICCDKHGGRSRYLPLIQQHLTNQVVSIEIESRPVSRYRWQAAGRTVTIQFAAKGESQLPVAFASMVSKYTREVFMLVWNDFWDCHVDNLKPTKGYPVDAKRFMKAIEPARRKLGIELAQLWRCR